MIYTIEEHQHRFASWAASRGASTSPKCRFEVQLGKKILEESGLKEIANSLSNLPNPIDFDTQHLIWRNNVIKVAKKYNKEFSHGVAAKLINLYLKSIFVCGENINHEKIKAIHPPIDSILLDALLKGNIGKESDSWRRAKQAKWSKFTSAEYEEVITAIQNTLGNNHGLWEIEQYWQGYQ